LAEQAIYEQAFKLGKTMWKNVELEYDATHDELTGVLNRRGFKAAAAHEVENWRTETGSQIGPSVLFIDGTNVKAVNDILGHDEGDKFIVATADVLNKSIREGDILARIGGDEFVILPVAREDELPLQDVESMKLRIAEGTAALLEKAPQYAKLGVDIAVGSAPWTDSLEATEKLAEENMTKAKDAQHVTKGQYRKVS
jgi:diguanylate cyclase (GGDEF)-like protein